ncbi:unnamed protein product [Ixodes persulcatus]
MNDWCKQQHPDQRRSANILNINHKCPRAGRLQDVFDLITTSN